jgi:hypothetical protein
MRRLAFVGVLAALVIPAVALAHRPAHSRAAIVYHASGRYYGGLKVAEPSSAPLRCFKVVIATVGHHASSWAAWSWSKYGDQVAHARECRTADGISILHRIHGRWYVYWEGSDGYPPKHREAEGSFVLQGVPRRIAKDLIGAFY